MYDLFFVASYMYHNRTQTYAHIQKNAFFRTHTRTHTHLHTHTHAHEKKMADINIFIHAICYYLENVGEVHSLLQADIAKCVANSVVLFVSHCENKVCVCVYVCECVCVIFFFFFFVGVCVCVRERERERWGHRYGIYSKHSVRERILYRMCLFCIMSINIIGH